MYDLAKFNLRPDNLLIRKTVMTKWQEREDEFDKYVDMACRLLSDYLGRTLWEIGYAGKLKHLKILMEEDNHERVIEIGISGNMIKSETVKQYCYQFVKMAEDVTRKSIAIEAELDLIKSSWYYKLVHLFKKD